MSGEVQTIRSPGDRGVWAWITTVDHKRIGLLYAVSAAAFFFIGGLEALLVRTQLFGPNLEVLSAEAYNQLFTMHGLTMVFLVVMPIAAAFTNYFLPILIGARDVAFPRLNAFSYWLFLFSGLLIYSSFVLGGAPDGAWVGYAPLSTQLVEVVRMDFWTIGLSTLGVSSIAASANFIATAFTMRAPGMTMLRMPVFAWMSLVVAFLLIFSLPSVAIGLFQLFLDRNFGALFYAADAGGDPLLWQHLFWIFGHPEVYVLILPAMGIVSEVLPTFARKPLFGYPFVVFSGAAIGFIGFGVWSHHMFTSGMGPIAEAGFGVATMIIVVPTGVKIFNWIGTIWGGKIKFNTPMLFSLAFVAMFVIGGLSGVTHAVVPSDTQQHDTYYVVAHFHYVLFGGAVFGYVSGVYYWFPKWTGRKLNEALGKVHFWLALIGFNLTFGPMHILGLNGMPRRTYRYPEGLGWANWNAVATIGAYTILVAFLVFAWNIVRTHYFNKGERVGNDPWDGRTLEWTIPSPPPVHNFDETPIVHSLDDFWHQKYAENEEGRAVRIPAVTGGAGEDVDRTGAEHGTPEGIHMPSPSYYPALSSLGIAITGAGLIYLPWGFAAIGVGVVVMIWGLFGWSLEPVTKEHSMSDAAVTDLDHTADADHHDVKPVRKTAMWVFLGSECVFFGAMISTFLLYRNTTNDGPGSEIFDIPFTSASSFVLLMSSLTMVLAHNAFEKNDMRQTRIWLTGTALLGATFLAGQIFEFTEFIDQGLTMSTSPFGSSFYMLTGFHGMHVALGVILLAAMAVLSLSGRLYDDRGLNVELVGLYWHFVDIVWIVIFTVVYLLQV